MEFVVGVQLIMENTVQKQKLPNKPLPTDQYGKIEATDIFSISMGP